MMKIRYLIYIPFLLFLLSVTSCSKNQDQDATAVIKEHITIATINGSPVYEEDILRRLTTIDKAPEKIKAEDPGTWDRMWEVALESEILDRLIIAAAKKEGITNSPEELDEEMRKTVELLGEDTFAAMLAGSETSSEDYRSFLSDRLLVKKYKDKLLADIVIPEEYTKAYYDGHGEGFMTKEKVRLEVIITSREDESLQVLQRLQNGEPFDTVSQEFSTIAEEGLKGRTRLLPVLSIPEAIRQHVKQAEVGKLLGPINYADNYYVIRVLERQESRKIPYEEAKPMIIESIRNRKEMQVLDSWYTTTLKNVTVEYYHTE